MSRKATFSQSTQVNTCPSASPTTKTPLHVYSTQSRVQSSPKSSESPWGLLSHLHRQSCSPEGPTPGKQLRGTQLDEEEPSPAGSCLGTKTLSAQALLFLLQKGERKKHTHTPEREKSELPGSIWSSGPAVPIWNSNQAVLGGGNILLKCAVNFDKQGFALCTEGSETDVIQEVLRQGQDFILT